MKKRAVILALAVLPVLAGVGAAVAAGAFDGAKSSTAGYHDLDAAAAAGYTVKVADLAGIGCDIVTIGQYLRPTSHHLPVARWVHPSTFTHFAEVGERFGIRHVESSPLTRSSYHARQAAEAALPMVAGSR